MGYIGYIFKLYKLVNKCTICTTTYITDIVQCAMIDRAILCSLTFFVMFQTLYSSSLDYLVKASPKSRSKKTLYLNSFKFSLVPSSGFILHYGNPFSTESGRKVIWILYGDYLPNILPFLFFFWISLPSHFNSCWQSQWRDVEVNIINFSYLLIFGSSYFQSLCFHLFLIYFIQYIFLWTNNYVTSISIYVYEISKNTIFFRMYKIVVLRLI